MKTKLISKLKKDLLVVEAKNESIALAMIFNEWGAKEILRWTLLGKPDEIKEDDVVDLVEKVMNGQHFQNYNYKEIWERWVKTALESFNSALESEIYWDVNPIKFGMYAMTPTGIKDTGYNDWHEAQEKTFDRKRTLIFAKQ